MLRTLFSLVTIACLATALPQHASAAQQKPAGRSSSAKPAVTGTVNINTASAAELETLPGVGARTAARIIEYRQKNGPFKKVEELMNVQGIGEKNFLKLKNNLSIAAARPERAGEQQ